MVPRRGDAVCTSRLFELRYLTAWAERADSNSIDSHIDLPACYHALRPRSQVAQLKQSRSTNGVTTPGDHRGPGGTSLT
ncbi:hypothetical protein SprV_0702373100 [Sparganum proliferum]